MYHLKTLVKYAGSYLTRKGRIAHGENAVSGLPGAPYHHEVTLRGIEELRRTAEAEREQDVDSLRIRSLRVVAYIFVVPIARGLCNLLVPGEEQDRGVRESPVRRNKRGERNKGRIGDEEGEHTVRASSSPPRPERILHDDPL